MFGSMRASCRLTGSPLCLVRHRGRLPPCASRSTVACRTACGSAVAEHEHRVSTPPASPGRIQLVGRVVTARS